MKVVLPVAGIWGHKMPADYRGSREVLVWTTSSCPRCLTYMDRWFPSMFYHLKKGAIYYFKKCNLTLAMSPACHSKSLLPKHWLYFLFPSNTGPTMNYFLLFSVKSRQTDRQTTDRQADRQTESDAYEPTAQGAQVGSKRIKFKHLSSLFISMITFCKREKG